MARQTKQAAAESTVAEDAPEIHELSREALAAALPDISDVTADLVGWASATQAHERAGLSLPRARRVLAAALGVPDAALTRMRDEDVARAVDRLRALVDQCARLAGQVTVDELTETLRRGAGMAALQREIDRSRRLPGKGLAVIFVDVDGLKAVNDRDGHAAGDERLRTTAVAMRERLRSYDLVIRYGGDEFVCVLTDSGAADAERTAATLRAHVAERTGGTISVGIASLEPDDSVDVLVQRADTALYAGRRARSARTVRAGRR
ncbi:MAG: GGDEF domain-containing protein [Candidatus Dormibacteraeota bacterium]|nr:GGDEF domain-containing protein [Candidatus Dormibacteraeota bacterium]